MVLDAPAGSKSFLQPSRELTIIAPVAQRRCWGSAGSELHLGGTDVLKTCASVRKVKRVFWAWWSFIGVGVV